MKRFGVRVAGALVLALLPLSAGTALAAQSRVWATVEIYRGTDLVASYTGSVDCGAASCAVSVPMANRDLNRFQRWCGSSVVVDIWPGALEAYSDCAGSGNWSVHVRSGLMDGDSNPTTEPADVFATVSGS